MSDWDLIRERLQAELTDYEQDAINLTEADLDSGDPNNTLAIATQLQALTLVLKLILLHLREKDDL